MKDANNDEENDEETQEDEETDKEKVKIKMKIKMLCMCVPSMCTCLLISHLLLPPPRFLFFLVPIPFTVFFFSVQCPISQQFTQKSEATIHILLISACIAYFQVKCNLANRESHSCVRLFDHNPATTTLGLWHSPSYWSPNSPFSHPPLGLPMYPPSCCRRHRFQGGEGGGGGGLGLGRGEGR